MIRQWRAWFRRQLLLYNLRGAPSTACKAAETLGSTGDKRVAVPLMNAFRHVEDHDVRRSILKALGALGDRRSVELLTNVLTGNRDSELRDDAEEALVAIGRSDATYINQLADDFFRYYGLGEQLDRTQEPRAVLKLAEEYIPVSDTLRHYQRGLHSLDDSARRLADEMELHFLNNHQEAGAMLVRIGGRTVIDALKPGLTCSSFGIRLTTIRYLCRMDWQPSSDDERILCLIVASDWDSLRSFGEAAVPSLVAYLELDLDWEMFKREAIHGLTLTVGVRTIRILVDAMRHDIYPPGQGIDVSLERVQSRMQADDIVSAFERIGRPSDAIEHLIATFLYKLNDRQPNKVPHQRYDFYGPTGLWYGTIAELGDGRVIEPMVDFMNFLEPLTVDMKLEAIWCNATLERVLERCANSAPVEVLRKVTDSLTDGFSTFDWGQDPYWHPEEDAKRVNCSYAIQLARQEIIRRGLEV